MSKAIYHAISSAKRHGGDAEDYLAIHEHMDQSKGAIPDNRHRILTHQSWYIKNVLQKVFGDYFVVPTTDEGRTSLADIAYHENCIVNIKKRMRDEGQGRVVSVAQIGEDHILEDFNMKFIPTVQDYIEDGEMQLTNWMNNAKGGDKPSSAKGLRSPRLND